MWIITSLVVCVFLGVDGACPRREGGRGGMLEEGANFTHGCMTCTCEADGLFTCGYPECDHDPFINPCLRYGEGCCSACEQYGCYLGERSDIVVPEGTFVHPLLNDPCLNCVCSLGNKYITCRAVMCERPSCPTTFIRRPGSCCDYDCPRGVESEP